MAKTNLFPGQLGVAVSVLILAGIPLPAQFARQAETAIRGAVKVSINPPKKGPQAGDPIEFAVLLQNGLGAAATLPKGTQVEVQLWGSSGDLVQKRTCTVPAGAADAKCVIPAAQAGLYKVKAVPDNRELLEGSSYVLVRPDNTRKKAAPIRKPPAAQLWLGIPLLAVAYSPDDSVAPKPAATTGESCGATRSLGHATVILTINEGGEVGGAFRAGVENAMIQAFFQADDGGSAPSDVLVWLSPDHGALDHEPLVIPKCSISGEAQLSSKYPVRASVIYKVVPGSYAVQAPATLQANFVRPIIGIGIVPDGVQTLSLIDRGPIVAQFFDASGEVVPTDSERTVTFVSDNSVISPKQQTITLKPGDYTAATVILPFWLGKGTIFVTADRLKTASHQVSVIGQIVIAVCLIGGIVGGLVSFLVSGGSVYSRLIVGLAAGVVLTWAYVFGLLPKVDATVAHNYISVFVVSLLGGYSGIKAFDLVLKRLGWAT
jgi:hypothetical protein